MRPYMYDRISVLGTVSVGTETLHGGADLGRNDGDADIAVQVELSRNDEDDQNDVVCSTAADRTASRDSVAPDDRAYSASTCTASFSRSFSSDSADGGGSGSGSGDRPLFINVIESGDEFKTIMDRNNKARQQGSAIDEQVTYFPELFTHTQYKMYENSSKTAGAGEDCCGGADGDGRAVNIYVPKKLDADELRNKLREICYGKQREQEQRKSRPGDGKKATVADGPSSKNSTNNSSFGGPPKRHNNNAQKMKCNQTTAKKTSAAMRKTSRPVNGNNGKPGPRTTFYFELDPKGKLKPLNGNDGETAAAAAAANSTNNKFFRINLKAAKNERGKTVPRNCGKTPNTDLFLEFQTDKCGRKGAKLIIKKKPPPTTEETGATNRPNSNKRAGGSDAERSRLPGYNGLRSEYGLSAEQLLERRRIKTERETRRREYRQKKHEEEQKKRAENEKNFYKWLQQKKHLKKLQAKTSVRHSYPINRLTLSSARTSV